MDKFSDNANVFDLQPFGIKGVAEAFAAINPESDGWFTGTCVFQVVGGKVTRVDETKIVRAQVSDVKVTPHAKYTGTLAEPTKPYPAE